MDPPENGFPGLVVGPRVGEEGTQGGPQAGEQPGKHLCLLSSSRCNSHGVQARVRCFCSVENTSWFTTDSCEGDRRGDLG